MCKVIQSPQKKVSNNAMYPKACINIENKVWPWMNAVNTVLVLLLNNGVGVCLLIPHPIDHSALVSSNPDPHIAAHSHVSEERHVDPPATETEGNLHCIPSEIDML